MRVSEPPGGGGSEGAKERDAARERDEVAIRFDCIGEVLFAHDWRRLRVRGERLKLSPRNISWRMSAESMTMRTGGGGISPVDPFQEEFLRIGSARKGSKGKGRFFLDGRISWSKSDGEPFFAIVNLRLRQHSKRHPICEINSFDRKSNNNNPKCSSFFLYIVQTN